MLNKITGYGSVKSAGSVKRRSSVAGVKSFSELMESAAADEAAAVTQLSDVAATAAVNNMLSLQEVSEEDARRKKLAQQGNNMLESLEKLRKQLLTGAVPTHTLQELSRQLSVKKQSVSDPALTALIDDIELRVAVELAKLEKAVQDGA